MLRPHFPTARRRAAPCRPCRCDRDLANTLSSAGRGRLQIRAAKPSRSRSAGIAARSCAATARISRPSDVVSTSWRALARNGAIDDVKKIGWLLELGDAGVACRDQRARDEMPDVKL